MSLSGIVICFSTELNMNRSLGTFTDGEHWVKVNHFTKKGMDITGVIHVGTNDWFEYDQYLKMGIEHLLGFEPLQEPIRRFRDKHPDIKSPIIYNVALGNEDDFKEINVAYGDQQCSSFYNLTEEYRKDYPEFHNVGKEAVRVMKFTTWVKLYPEIDLSLYNCLVVDVEGFELEVLKGMGPYLEGFTMLNIECSGKKRYDVGPLAPEIITFLAGKGFVQDSPIEDYNDIFFIRRDQ